MADTEIEKVKRAAAATISKLTDEQKRTSEQLRVLQRAVSESQRVAAEATEKLETLRGELETEKKVSVHAEERVADKLQALERQAKLEREKAAAAELAHNAALAAAAAAAAASEQKLREELAAAKADAAAEKERVSELQRTVEHLTKAGEEAKELWARLKQALLVRVPARSALPGCLGPPPRRAARAHACCSACDEEP